MEDGGAAIRARRKVREEKEKEAGALRQGREAGALRQGREARALRQGREAGAAFWTLPAPGAGH